MSILNTFIGLAFVLVCVSACDFDIERCEDNDAGFVAAPCGNSCFYTCTAKPEGGYSAVKRCCNKCEQWSQDILTCVKTDSPNCVFNPTTEEAACELVVGPNPYTFYNGLELMNCAVGTEFNQTACGCVTSTSNPLNDGSQITCITFDNGWNNLQGTGGVYVESNNVYVVENCSVDGQNCGYFNMSSMKIPLFANCLDSNLEFSMAAFVKRDAGVSGQMSVVGNGDCGVESSFDVISHPNEYSATVRNSDDVVANSGVISSPDGQFVHLAVVYDGNMVTSYRDGVQVSIQPIFGRLKRVYHEMVVGNSICDGTEYFSGFMDTISFARVAFSPAQVLDLSNNREKCLPTV